MNTKISAGIVAVVLALTGAVCAAGTVLLDGPASACATTPSATPAPVATLSGGWSPVGRFDADQVAIAATIISIGARMGVPIRGWVIAVAAALQESGLRNLPDGDRDSVGVFQQRPGHGWGTAAQLRDPAYASGKFYATLLAIPNWQTMPLAEAAQAVQVSRYPDAYAKREPDAALLVNAITAADPAILQVLARCLDPCVQLSATPTGSGSAAGCLDGGIVLARAATWLTAWNGGPVPYESSPDPATWLHGYRRDCSGYASMALGLPGPGLDAAGLAAWSAPISKTDLRPGDLLINPAAGPAGHVVIFDHWTDATMTGYVGYEQSGDGGTHHRTIPYPYTGDYPMTPYRYGISAQPALARTDA